MHIYRVVGQADNASINEDVKAAEDGFNLNARNCTCGFFVKFNVTITDIPADSWRDIDKDGDGLDRHDANGDGDYGDPHDHNELLNLMNLNFFDVGANTENIYYVPGIKGGWLGMTYKPNMQIAIDNSKDGDNLTLMHEKVHELDLRKDGKFDINDSPKDVGNAQGARDRDNIMNYDNTGTSLTRKQCEFLNP